MDQTHHAAAEQSGPAGVVGNDVQDDLGGLRMGATGGAYAAQAGASSLRSEEANAKRNSPPSVIADANRQGRNRPPPQDPLRQGFGARPLIGLRRILPDRAFDSVIS